MSTAVTVDRTFPGGVVSATWAALGGAEAGDSVQMAQYPDRTVTVAGTFGSATVTIEGSNDGVTWFGLTKPGATAISLTAGGVASIVENPMFIRPKATGGTGSAILVVVVGK
jgi:hypothetical protein